MSRTQRAQLLERDPPNYASATNQLPTLEEVKAWYPDIRNILRVVQYHDHTQCCYKLKPGGTKVKKRETECRSHFPKVLYDKTYYDEKLKHI
jgi:hypothetical protein